MTTHLDTESGAWWETARAAFFTDAAAEAAAEPAAPSAEDIELSDWAANREALGLGTHDTGDFIGVDRDQVASGMPDWRYPTMPEEITISDMDHYAAQRKELGIKETSDVFGAASPQPRTNASPWRAV